MAKVTFIPGSGTLAAYLSGEIDTTLPNRCARKSTPKSMTAFPNF